MPTITRVITGDVDDLASVTLLTLVRTDTGAAVATGGTAFTQAGNTWTLSFTAPAAGLTYAYTYRRAFDDGSHLDGSGTLVDAGSDYQGRYLRSTQFGVYLDEVNLTAYTDTDSNGVRNPGAVEQVIKWAEGRVDLHAAGPYTFTDDANGQIAADVFSGWTAILATQKAVAKRVPVTNDSYLALRQDVAEAIAEMKAFAAGTLNLPGAVPANEPEDDATPRAGTMTTVAMSFEPECATDEYAS